MADGVLIEDLSVAPSRTWPTIIERHQAVTDYLEINNPTTSDVDRFAQRVGLSRRMFYRLIDDRKRRLAGHSSATLITGRGRPITLEQETAISDALTRLGPGALTRDVYTEAAVICAERGIPAPSDYAVTSRVRAPRERVEIRARLHRRFDWILDTSQLDFDVIESDGNSGPAYMLALIDVHSGETLAHQVHPGKPSSLAIANLILPKIAQLHRPNPRRASLAVTTILWPEALLLESLLRRHALEAAECAPRTVRSGEALMFVFGPRIGNISLRPRPRRSSSNVQPAIEIALAEAVVGSLVSKRNEALSAKPLSARTDVSIPRQVGGARTIPQHAPSPA